MSESIEADAEASFALDKARLKARGNEKLSDEAAKPSYLLGFAAGAQWALNQLEEAK